MISIYCGTKTQFSKLLLKNWNFEIGISPFSKKIPFIFLFILPFMELNLDLELKLNLRFSWNTPNLSTTIKSFRR